MAIFNSYVSHYQRAYTLWFAQTWPAGQSHGGLLGKSSNWPWRILQQAKHLTSSNPIPYRQVGEEWLWHSKNTAFWYPLSLSISCITCVCIYLYIIPRASKPPNNGKHTWGKTPWVQGYKWMVQAFHYTSSSLPSFNEKQGPILY